MLNAKLFDTLVSLQLGVALLEGRTHPSIDLFFHATYFVIPKIHLQTLLALINGLFGLIYFASSRWVSHPLNNSLGLIHFVLSALGFVLFSVSLSALGSAALSDSSTGQSSDHYWPALTATLGLLCSLLGCATLAVNCGLTAIRAFQPRNC
jgi:heme/copper-type cytochrome/quinol oxidase subunit 1